MLASLTGQRMLFNYMRIGGVNGDLNHEFMSRLGDWMSHATEQIEAGNALLNENEIFVRRMRGLGVIDRETALRMAMTGPNLRATGVPFDVRRAHPVQRLPGARVRHPDADRGRLPGPLPAPDGRDQAEPPDHRPVPPPDARRPDHGQAAAPAAAAARPAYAAIESPRGQYAAYVISDGTDQPFRLRIHDPSFIHLQAVGLMMPGHLIADTMAVMASPRPDHGRRGQVSRSARRGRCALPHAGRSRRRAGTGLTLPGEGRASRLRAGARSR